MPKKKDEPKTECSPKELIDIKFNYDKQRHEWNMEELIFARETNKLRHDNDMERQRIKSAEIRKMQERKEQSRGFRY